MSQAPINNQLPGQFPMNAGQAPVPLKFEAGKCYKVTLANGRSFHGVYTGLGVPMLAKGQQQRPPSQSFRIGKARVTFDPAHLVTMGDSADGNDGSPDCAACKEGAK